jgi:hypothetical protein
MLSELFLVKLHARFAGRKFVVGNAPGPIVSFPAVHPGVGPVEVFDHGRELTVELGEFSHIHFSLYNYGEDVADQARAEDLTDDVIDFLDKLFSDQIVMWRSPRGGRGSAERTPTFSMEGRSV